MHEFWYNYVKSKCGEKTKLCYMNADSFIVYMKTQDIYVDIAKDVETRFYTSNYELDRPFPTGKNKSNWINERCKLMAEFPELRPKT